MARTYGAALLLIGAFATCASAQTATTVGDRRLDAAAVFKKTNTAVVTITTPSGFGSGVIVDSSGVIATNLHVVRGDLRATVTLANHDAYDDVEVVDVDARKDLVLLKVKAFKLPSLALGDSDDLSVGNAVYALGAPKGFELTMSEGIVSGLRDSGEGYGVIQTTAAISPGSSGGGLFNGRGELVGITTYKIKGGENLNFAIPINFIRGMLATTVKFTLTQLAEKYPATDAPAAGAGGAANPSEAAVNRGIPRLAGFYATPDGTIVLFEQEGESAHATWSNSKGEVYGHTAFVWNVTRNAFAGNGILKQVRRCGRNDRVFDFAVAEEIYVVNDRVISNRSTAPMAIDCSTGAVKSYHSKEQLWYAPQK